MVVLFSAFGILLWVGFLLALAVLFGVIWVVGQTVLGIAAFIGLLTRQKEVPPVSGRNLRPTLNSAPPQRHVPPVLPTPAPAPIKQPAAEAMEPALIPKWTAAHRHYVDRDLADWQKQFDSLNSRRL